MKRILIIILSSCLACYAQIPSTDLSFWLHAGSLAQTVGTQVPSWTSTAGTTTTFAQYVSGKQPLYEPDPTTGVAAVLFDGLSQFLTNITATPVVIPQPYTIFIAYDYVGVNDHRFWLISNGLVASYFGIGSDGNADYELSVSAEDVIDLQPYMNLAPHLLEVVFNGASSSYRVDGQTLTTFTNSPGTNTMNTVQLSGESALGDYLANAYIMDVAVYTGDQSANGTGGDTAILSYLDGINNNIIERQAPPNQATGSGTILDRSPIGQEVLSGAPNVLNPRGWFNGAYVDYSSYPAGWLAFSNAFVARESGNITLLTALHSHRIVFWDFEGHELSSLLYIGDPRCIPLFAPEMWNVLPYVVQMYKNAGFEVGFTLRPQTFGWGPTLPSIVTNGEAFVLTSAAFGLKQYYGTNNTWTFEPTNNGLGLVTVTTNSYNDLTNKELFCFSNFGNSLVFYVDSYDTIDFGGPYTTGVLSNMVAVSGGWPKGVMLAPEAANNTSWAINYFGVSAPYLQANITDYTTPTNILARYPNAFSLILLNFINTNIPAIVAGSTAGNIYLFNCWYSNANTTAIFQMQTNSPPNAFYAGPPWATNAP